MLRLMVAGVLVGAGLVASPMANADPQTCPPTCDLIPATAWVEPWAIPMNATHQWPRPATVAVPVAAPRFRFEELCATPAPRDDPRAYAVAARATVASPPGRWNLQAQVLHWRGDTSQGGAWAMQVHDAAVAALRSCQVRAPQYSPTLTTADDGRLAAVISGPHVVHQYLIADPSNSSVSELVLWTTPGPDVQWPMVSDDRVLDALEAALCGAYLGSCG
ncbi:ATPase [Mycobacterium sp. ACS4331]|uniref:ATPase n=1 Tax=Mycobacterium sp. ACS4331 TaxID=1834121 RepID=UPI000B2EF74B|nr:ATPase [Mycobacterium sp. ACS4331]